GHNGLKNIEDMIGGQDYPRLKFGIGDDYPKGRQVDYVLSPFSKKEFETLTIELDRCIDMIYAFCSIGIERTMNQFN
ncbi:MAG: aminoacyl-tRNA hydrolase, partial [Cyclobacteriaceae bacterium]